MPDPSKPPPRGERLQKLIAAAGLCSRRNAEDLLRNGRVRINNRVAQLGDRADPEHDDILVDGQPLRQRTEPLVLLMNKPRGVISSCHDPEGRRIVLDLLPPSLRRGLHPVGRLDAESRGALLLTNQGELTLQLTHPRYAHSKTYRVLVQGRPSQQALNAWRNGMLLDERMTQPAEVKELTRGKNGTWLEVVLREGRNRQIRRLADQLGHPVLDLQRVAIASLSLGSLEEGRWRRLKARECALLKSPPR